ncbi:PQ loop repeat-domain-containing protein [Schizophyllum amplum]|uniref:PQ loop repeat-domain-containing protein n=1 Tax=Schizophyllum amplum TaxID=97359 RepID=A0A550CH51_9AGAR|nr:PQ loop repeat-domain-containing protein [Auriculariopsis ampla]
MQEGTLGWISIACWIIVFSPQLYENYALQSGEGLSLGFVIIWLVGDLTNLAGAVLGNLLPTVILLAVYVSHAPFPAPRHFALCRWTAGLTLSARSRIAPESAPLLPEADRAREAKAGPSTRAIVFRYVAAFAFVIATGIAAWGVSRSTDARAWAIQILGWTSAVLYLGARIPQIRKNVETRCEGLAPGLFVFAIFGNMTYALSICAQSMDGAYLVKNASWLAGSALTVFLDVTVLCQFFYYRRQDGAIAREREASHE